MTTPARPAGPTSDEQDALDAATARLLSTVGAMSAEEWAAPSLLPGWSRAHVVAHLALNAEGLAAVVATLGRGEPAAMYTSTGSRDADIEALALEPVEIVGGRLRAGCATFGSVVREAPEAVWYAGFARVPGAPEILGALVHPMRHREVEIHHADLGLGYGAADWPADFTAGLLDSALADRVEQAATVHGAAADLAWWLLGRGSGEGLTSDAGALPDPGAWPGTPR